MRAANGKGHGCDPVPFQKITNNDLNYPTGARPCKAADAANLIARLALAGHAVNRGAAGDFLVSKFGMSRWCENLDELRAFAVRLGVLR